MNRPDARALIETLAAHAQGEAGDPVGDEPNAEELLDYLRGDLGPEEAAGLSRRLVADPAAARALLDLAELEQAAQAADESHLADPETRTGWRDLATRLPRAPQPPVHRRPMWLNPVWLSSALALLFCVLSVGLGIRVAQLEGERGAPRELATLELAAGRSAAAASVEVAAGAPLALTLAPGLAPGESCTGLSAEIAPPAGGEPFVVDGLSTDGLGLVTLLLPQAAAGVHQVSLSGCRPVRTLAELSFRVVRPGGDGDG